MESYAISRLGFGKTVNEDSFGSCSSADGKVRFFVVADGMGGHAAGDVAGSITVSGFIDAAENYRYEDEESLRKFITATVVSVSRSIEDDQAEHPERKDMGSTIVMIAFIDGEDKALLCNAGDSRAYCFREGKLCQITKDHSIAQLMLDKGYTREDIKKYLSTNAITKAMGFLSGEGPGGLPDIYTADYRKGDLFLLCSDGLTSVADDLEISAIFKENEHGSCKTLCKSFVKCALGFGSKDDITVELIRI